MKEEFSKYLKKIDTTDVIRKRVEAIYNFYKDVCPEEIDGIFITDYITEDGRREYENLWFFSNNYCMEAHNFLERDEFDIEKMSKRVLGWNIEKNNYDLNKKPTEKSRLLVHIKLTHTTSCVLKASKNNCEFLMQILLKYAIPLAI